MGKHTETKCEVKAGISIIINQQSMALFRLLPFLFLCSCIIAVSADIGVYDCRYNSNITSSQMSANLDLLLAQVESSTAKNRFSAATYGKGADQVYALGQCMANTNSTACKSCIKEAAEGIRSDSYTNCRNQTGAWLWQDYNCLVRYEAFNFFGKFDPTQNASIWDDPHPQHPSAFVKQLTALISKVRDDAIVPANQGLAKAQSTSTASNATIYALAQCTRDVSLPVCTNCLDSAVANPPHFCQNLKTTACRVMYTSCLIHYETSPFY